MIIKNLPALILMVASSLLVGRLDAAEQPNIVFIFADDSTGKPRCPRSRILRLQNYVMKMAQYDESCRNSRDGADYEF